MNLEELEYEEDDDLDFDKYDIEIEKQPLFKRRKE
jgi:hypothetical protein